jgi:ferric-dicitrate binding protein FerR (iron transport regulator)
MPSSTPSKARKRNKAAKEDMARANANGLRARDPHAAAAEKAEAAGAEERPKRPLSRRDQKAMALLILLCACLCGYVCVCGRLIGEVQI